MSSMTALLLSLGVWILLGCVEPGRADSLPIRTIAKGALSGIQEAKQEVIKDQATWEKTWAKHATRVAEKLPEVDFSKEMVIVSALGRKNTGGFTVEITKAEIVGDKLRITVQRKSPPPGAITIQMITAPFHMVAIPKTDRKPEFVETKAPETKTARPPHSPRPE